MKGRIGGMIPYDLERPTIAKLKDTWWNPADERVIRPQPFGIGWTFNFASLKRRYPVLFWLLVGFVAWRIVRALRSGRAS